MCNGAKNHSCWAGNNANATAASALGKGEKEEAVAQVWTKSMDKCAIHPFFASGNVTPDRRGEEIGEEEKSASSK